MFNAPRPTQARSNLGNFGASFVEDNDPLSVSVYDDGLDPWSAAPSPSPPTLPVTSGGSGSTSLFNSVIADAIVPPIYQEAFSAVDPSNSGETSVNSLSRVLGTSGLSASTIEKIVSLVSSRPRVSRLEFFVALALVALAQSGKDVSVEQVAKLAEENTLPEPSLDLSQLSAAPSTFSFNRQASNPIMRASAPAYSSDDPWSAPSRLGATGGGPANVNDTAGQASLTNGAPSSVSGTGLPRDWWKKQEKVAVNFLGQQGFILNRYMVYEVITERGAPVPRRYSEFVFLFDCLIRRYPFRIIPQLPPKRVGPDESFLEQRRKGLQRFMNFVVNHPVIKEDGLLAVFLTEPSLEQWRKHSSISLEEESASKRVDRIEEMTIPSDLEEKLGNVRGKIVPLIEAWQKISILAERIIRKREAAAVRIPPNLRPSYLPSHFALPLFSSTTPASSSPLSSSASSTTLRPSTASILSSDSSLSRTTTLFHNFAPAAIFAGHGNASGMSMAAASDMQADLARLTNTFKVLVEVSGQCWRGGEECELSEGVKKGIKNVADHTQRETDLLEQRTRTLLNTTLEGLKSQRDLYIAMRDLFIRHDRLSVDQVERLKKRVETNSLKLEGIRAAKKERWEEEEAKLSAAVEKDKVSITAQLNRRVFIRACMWHELRVILHNRENTLLTQLVQLFAREEQEYADSVAANWASLVEAVESMPLE